MLMQSENMKCLGTRLEVSRSRLTERGGGWEMGGNGGEWTLLCT